MTTDFGFKKVNVDEKRKLVTEVFNSVADKYDLMNDLMSLGIHRLWKRQAISMCQIRAHHHVLDLAGGTGDLTRLIAPKVSSGQLTLCDINAQMLKNAKTRLIDNGIFDKVCFSQANAEALPFESNTFDRIIIGFGLRNVTHKEKALASMLLPVPGGPQSAMLCPPEAAIIRARLALSWPLISEMLTNGVSPKEEISVFGWIGIRSRSSR